MLSGSSEGNVTFFFLKTLILRRGVGCYPPPPEKEVDWERITLINKPVDWARWERIGYSGRVMVAIGDCSREDLLRFNLSSYEWFFLSSSPPVYCSPCCFSNLLELVPITFNPKPSPTISLLDWGLIYRGEFPVTIISLEDLPETPHPYNCSLSYYKSISLNLAALWGTAGTGM